MEDASPDESCICGMDLEVRVSRSEVDSGILRPSNAQNRPIWQYRRQKEEQPNRKCRGQGLSRVPSEGEIFTLAEL